jgi:hypothetical protein
MYMVDVNENAWLQTSGTQAYSFDSGDFSIVFMVRMKKSGLVIEYRDYDVKDGYQLEITEQGAVYFDTGLHGEMHFATTINGVIPADNSCRVVSVVRSDGYLAIFIDGVAIQLSSGMHSVHFPWTVGVPVPEPLEIGRGRMEKSFVGSVMNVGMWSRALNPTELQQAGFAVLADLGEGLQGYWTLNGTLADSSPHGNSAAVFGEATFSNCIGCVWVQGDHDFRYVQMQRHPNTELARAGVSTAIIRETLSLEVAQGSKAMFFSLMQGENGPIGASPGTDLVIFDPTGRQFNKTPDSDKVFIYPGGGDAEAVVVIDPMPGKWRLQLSCRPDQPAFLQAQVIPSHNVAPTTLAALRPFYSAGSRDVADPTLDLSWKLLWETAVTAVTGVVVAGAIAAGSEVIVPAALVTGIILLGAGPTGADATNVVRGSEQRIDRGRYVVGASANFVAAEQRVMLIDAGENGDYSERIVYEQRQDCLLPFLAVSSFKDHKTIFKGPGLTEETILDALRNQVGGYVTTSGHGVPTALLGVAKNGTYPNLINIKNVTRSEVDKKIFHFFACWTGGKQLNNDSPGLGETLVQHGADAFFGYSRQFVIPEHSTPNIRWLMCEPDMLIDQALLQGQTCEEAYAQANRAYNLNIARLKDEGHMVFAKAMVVNKSRLVAPSTDEKFGKKTARLNAGT